MRGQPLADVAARAEVPPVPTNHDRPHLAITSQLASDGIERLDHGHRQGVALVGAIQPDLGNRRVAARSALQ